MGPRKRVVSKKKKTSDAGHSSVPRPVVGSFNRDKFLGPKQEEWYRELVSRNIWFERTFNINLQGEFKNYMEIIEAKNWQRLFAPPT